MLENIRLICKEIINKEFPEEIEYFDAIWEVMKEFIDKWNENIPEELIFEEYQKGLEKDLGFLDESEISGFNTPKVIALLNLSWLRLTGVKGQIKEEEIGETITKYGKDLPEWLKIKTINLAVPLIKEDLKQIAKMAGEEVEKEEKKYIMYSHENKEGKPITESDYLERRKMKKNDYIIWMDEINKIFRIKNKGYKIGSRSAEVLKYLIRKRGIIADYRELFEEFCDVAKDPEIYLKNEDWNKSLNIYAYRWVSDIHAETKGKLKGFIIRVRERGYRIADEDEEVKYCLIDYLKK